MEFLVVVHLLMGQDKKMDLTWILMLHLLMLTINIALTHLHIHTDKDVCV